MPLTLDHLRAHAVSRSLFAATTLEAAIARLGFVQADPIRAPARAQDLILRQRVDGYRAGDLERAYPALDVEEDLLYAYGFLTRPAWQLLHPRRPARLTRFERNILARVRDEGPTHPRQLEALFGGGRVINAWGGTSRQTTAALERLHHLGLLRVARRDSGLRVYEAATPRVDAAAPREQRLRRLVLLIAHILAPVADPTLHTVAAYLGRWLPAARGGKDHRSVIRALVHEGELERHTVDGLAYLWPASTHGHEPPPRQVRFLAPFDPVVWDRRRFEHLWGWPYRFEAYTPPARRVRGYYAMPLLWGEQVIGWANASGGAGAPLDVELGFQGRRPRGREFSRAAEAEIARLEAFLVTSGATSGTV